MCESFVGGPPARTGGFPGMVSLLHLKPGGILKKRHGHHSLSWTTKTVGPFGVLFKGKPATSDSFHWKAGSTFEPMFIEFFVFFFFRDNARREALAGVAPQTGGNSSSSQVTSVSSFPCRERSGDVTY